MKNTATLNAFTKYVLWSLRAAIVLAVFFVTTFIPSILFAQEEETKVTEASVTEEVEPSLEISSEEVQTTEHKPSAEVNELSDEQLEQIADLDIQLKEGKITQEEYDQQVAEITGVLNESLELRSMEQMDPEAQTLGKYITPVVSETNGSLNYQYPIVVPPGRNGLTPEINLTYNSTNKSQSSIVGLGWAFDIPYIQRVNKKGIEKLYTEDNFISSLDGELVDQGSGIFTPRTENGSFLKYEYTNDTWLVTDKEGTTYEFGTTTQARQDDPNDSSKIFSWMLETITDTNGNTIDYTYYKDQGQIYPDTISYADGLFEIEFIRTSRSVVNDSFLSAFKVTTNYYIYTVEISTDSSITSTYDILVTNGLVKDIQLTGFEGVNFFELPSMEFEYTNEINDGTWDRDSSYILPTRPGGNGVALSSLTNAYQDVNGDGLPDILYTASSYTYDPNNLETGVWINQGDGTWNRDSSYILPTDTNGRGISFSSTRHVFQDVNADGFPDFVVTMNSSTYDPNNLNYGVWINQKDGTWNRDSSYILPSLPGGNGITLSGRDHVFQDVNGDGLPDLTATSATFPYNPSSLGTGVWINQGSTFGNISKIISPQGGESEFTYTTAQIQDFSNQTPFLIPVVESMTNDDNNGNIATTSYEYRDADYYYNTPYDKKSAGFGSITKTNPDGSIETKKYHQANGETGNEPTDSYTKIGKAYEKTIKDSSSNLFNLKRTNYIETNLGGISNSIQPSSELTMQYDGTSSHVDTAVAYEYDVYGNIEEQTQYGEVSGNIDGAFTDTGSDKRTVEYTYTNDTTNYIVGLPNNQTLKNNNGSKEAETEYSYDTEGNLLTQSDWISGSDYTDTTYTYNSYGLPLTETDALSNTTTYTYDTEDMYPASIENAENHTTSYTYDYSSGKPETVIEPNGKVTEYDYDGLDRLIEVAQTIGNGTTEILREFNYNTIAFPQYIQETIHRSGTESQDNYTYTDGFGKVIQKKSEMDANWQTLDTVYDTMGRVVKQSLPYETTSSSNSSATTNADLMTEFSYDVLGRVLTTTNVKGTTSTTYDGFETTITDALSNTKDLITDAFGNLIQVKEYNGASTYTTDYQYNAQNLLTKITDAESNVRNIDYDGLGRRTELEDLHTSSDGTFGIWSFVYNDLNLTSQTDPKGTTTSYTYDDINRVLTEDSSGSAGVEATYTYDSCTNGTGQLCSVTTPDVTTGYTYLKQGVVDTESKLIDSVTYTTDTDYNHQGQPIKVTHPNSSYTEYGYNTQGLVDEVKYNGTSLVTANYGVHGRPTSINHENGVDSALTYDANELYELTNKTTTDGITDFQNLSYSYDDVGNITQIVDASYTTTAKTQTFTYDDFYRLIGTNVTGSANSADYTRSYSYSPIGNITAFNGITYTYADNGYNNPHAVSSVGANSYIYDNNGNLTNDGTWSHTWDYRNRLISSTDGVSSSSYEYDSNNQRIKLVEGADTTIYPTSDYEVKNGNVKVSLNLEDILVATDDNGTINHVHTDHLGGTNITTDTLGAVTQTLDYFPYGDMRVDTGVNNETKQYTGYTKDATTGLHYAGARYYNGGVGRFMSQDPVVLNIGDWKTIENKTDLNLTSYLSKPQTHNSYSYAGNNPVKNIDKGGEYLETAFDVAMLGLSAKDFQAQPTLANGVFVVLDGVALALPLPAIVGAVKHGDEAAQMLAKMSTKAGGINDSSKALQNIEGGVGNANAFIDQVLNSNKNINGITEPYIRPSNMTTQAQRDFVNKPGSTCIDCGVRGVKMYADHKNPLVKQYYETGSINISKNRQLDAVQPQCAGCSNKQGGFLSQISKKINNHLNLTRKSKNG